jgi:hypothetical protein
LYCGTFTDIIQEALPNRVLTVVRYTKPKKFATKRYSIMLKFPDGEEIEWTFVYAHSEEQAIEIGTDPKVLGTKMPENIGIRAVVNEKFVNYDSCSWYG